jgi:hypothetical protein
MAAACGRQDPTIFGQHPQNGFDFDRRNGGLHRGAVIE